MATKSTKPQAERGPIQQLIAGLIEGVLLVDPDGTIAWANEPALVMHGCERLGQLGGNARGYRQQFALRYRNHHALAPKQYPLAKLVAGEAFDGVTVELSHRRGDDGFVRMFETSGLVLTNRDGDPETLALMIKDVSGRFEAEDRFERAFAANPAPAVILRLADSRYVKVNRGFLDMTGYTTEEVVGRPMRELDVLRDAEQRDSAVAALRERTTIPQQESLLPVKDGDSKFVVVAGQPIELQDEPCVLFTFIDLDARKQAETSLRESEERFAKAFRLAPVPMLLCARQGLRIMTANDAFAAVTGHAHPDIMGRSVADIGLWANAKSLAEFRNSMDANAGIRDRDVQLRTRDGMVIDCLLSAEPATIQGNPCVLCVMQDVTERKRSEADLRGAIEAVMKDTSWFSCTVMEKLAQVRHASGSDETLDMLTPREREVLELLCKGQRDAEIAATLNLSRNTIRNHVATLYSKLGVNRRSAAVIWGRERGLGSY